MDKDKTLQIVSFGIIAAFLFGVGGLIYYKKTTNSTVQQSVHNTNPHIPRDISNYAVHGIDVSHHQGNIAWNKIEHPDTLKTIEFVFIRATVGNKKDTKFKRNWEDAQKQDFPIGAYHYYWANLNSTIQANHFIKQVKLKPGDLPPVLDIEKLSGIQSNANLRKGLKNWISIIEAHYGVKPIIYTGDSFYRHHLSIDPYFKNYNRLWIANYNNVSQPKSKWIFWQFTDRARVKGINGNVDFNVFKGSQSTFKDLLIKS